MATDALCPPDHPCVCRCAQCTCAHKCASQQHERPSDAALTPKARTSNLEPLLKCPPSTSTKYPRQVPSMRQSANSTHPQRHEHKHRTHTSFAGKALAVASRASGAPSKGMSTKGNSVSLSAASNVASTQTWEAAPRMQVFPHFRRGPAPPLTQGGGGTYSGRHGSTIAALLSLYKGANKNARQPL